MKELRFEFREILFLALCAASFSVAMWLYITNFPIHQYIFDIRFNLTGDKVGVLMQSNGSVRRKLADDSAYQDIANQNELYNYDTIVTGPESTATLSLDDGSAIDLSSNTMIQLVYAPNISIGGVSRAAVINVVAGKVTGKAKEKKIIIKTKEEVIQIEENEKKETKAVTLPPPKPVATVASVAPAPEPIAAEPTFTKVDPKVELLSPKRGRRLVPTLVENTPQVEIELKWKKQPKEAPVLVRVLKLDDGDEDVVFEEEVTEESLGGSIKTTLKSPGRYIWDVEVPEDEEYTSVRKRSTFNINRSFEGIELLDPLIAGQKFTNNQYRGQLLSDFSITFQWKAFPEADDYLLQFYRKPAGGKAIMTKESSETSHRMKQSKVFSGRFFYAVSSTLSDGWVVSSPRVPFRFDYLPPILVMPKNQAKLTPEDLKQNTGRILFTWQKTNFTEEYEIEFSKSPKFETFLKKKKLKENFFLLKAPKKGGYFWRVKSYAKGITSPPSPVNQFTVE